MDLEELRNLGEEKIEILLYEYHKEKHPRVYKRWMKDLAKLEAGTLERRVKGKIVPMSKVEKLLLREARETRII